MLGGCKSQSGGAHGNGTGGASSGGAGIGGKGTGAESSGGSSAAGGGGTSATGGTGGSGTGGASATGGSGGIATGGAGTGAGGAAATGGKGVGGSSAGGAAGAALNILTHHNDNQRTGANLQETILNTSNVNMTQFGKLFEWPVDGDIYAQPLYVSNVTIPGSGTHNVVYVVTMHNTLFAFDADSANTMPLFEVDLSVLGSPIPVSATVGLDVQPGPQDIATEIGTLSTPVIDLASRTLYLVSRSLDTAKVHHQKLHALDIATGMEKFGGPVELTAILPGTGSASKNGQLTFDPIVHNQRAALLLSGGNLYITWAGHNDSNDYHGWVMAYSASTLQRTAAFVDTPNGAWGGIWQTGAGPAADSYGNVYVETGNGDFDASKQNYGDSVLKLNGSTLGVTSSFTPKNQSYLTSIDLDLGSTGVVLVPGTAYAVAAGKEGKMYLLDTGSLGGFNATSDNVVDEFQATPLPSCDPKCANYQWTLYYHIHAQPVFWNSAAAGPVIYVWPERDYLKVFRIVQDHFEHTPAAQSLAPAPSGMPGGFIALSANGGTAGTGIVWALHPVSVNGSDTDASASGARVHGILQAFDASDVSKELYDSRMNASRDDLGNFAKFNEPMIVNGKVYVPTMSKKIVVYGLL